jgi:hypothetical protein
MDISCKRAMKKIYSVSSLNASSICACVFHEENFSVYRYNLRHFAHVTRKYILVKLLTTVGVLVKVAY